MPATPAPWQPSTNFLASAAIRAIFHPTLLLIAGVHAGSATISHPARAASEPPAVPQVAPGVWRVTTPLPFRPTQVHAWVVQLADGGAMLVDGGLNTPEAWSALDAGVHAAAGGWDAVRIHVVTHMHMDHVGLAARAAQASGATVVMHRLDVERMAHAAAHPDDEADYRAALLRRAGAPDEVLRAVEAARQGAEGLAPPVAADVMLDGESGELDGAPGWRWLWTPGHTAGHLSLFRAEDGVLIAGDAVLPRITPTLGVNRQRADPVGDYGAALHRLLALAPSLVLPGHGDPIADGSGRIAELLAAADAESDTVAGLLGDDGLTCWQVVDRRYPGREMGVSTRMLAVRETLAHLDRLAAAGRAVVAEDEHGAARFAAR
ncbi:MBL fold metallo-hydrolase [Longimicrobium terrae]|uniref:Glyoxylase-like metal-dependent hydrolase (Beta-lactamase superfamily II) n=1 Tax=Longimicrobium terrae TaxID=1639882 RepID=A0A841GWP9_9BACT|nr:MBL fold metallo-hydrolase [Longimicrobium terrae]MBB4634304.1 glyoxylase-like metal-dependent hydrolase (beta-lactamase superfamily II) [Longimicrobium terrae]MBB6068806.1 glyoxylase-like metal-dependent hydrolase (beta-lactamase superfamily II) [Longimicrobium terrae]NNC27991.1 MBL fold metallo-hydrolase [Longimicrobium terrae]